MKLNSRIRNRLADELRPDEQIVATVLLNNQIGTGSASSDGSFRQSSSSALGTAYARRLGLDLDNPLLRAQLLSSWCTVTDQRILFHRQKATAIRPTPGAPIEELPIAGTTVHHFDAAGLGMTNKVLHLTFPDGTQLISATMLKATLRREPFNDEPFLLIEAFGERATLVDNA
jgi:hypothetical protein